MDQVAVRARALEVAPEVRAADAAVAVAELQTRIAGAALLPTLRGEGGYLRSSVDARGVPDFAANNGENEYVARGVVSQTLFAGGALLAGKRQAAAARAGSVSTRAATRADVLLAADEAYFTVLAADARLRIANAARARSGELARAAHVRLATGEGTELDATKFDVQASSDEAAVEAARGDVSIARAALGTLLQLPPDVPLVVPGDEPSAGAVGEQLNDLVAAALRTRPEVQASLAEVDALRSAVDVARGARLPRVEAGAAAGWDSLTTPNGSNTGWQAGINMSVPIWDWNALAAKQHVAELEVDRAAQRLESLRRAVGLDVSRRFAELGVARARVAATKAARDAATRAAKMARDGYAIGIATSLDVVSAERDVTGAEAAYAGAVYAARVAASRLDFAVGRLR